MAGVVVHQFLLTKSTSEAENFTEQSLKPISIGEKYGYWMCTTTGIMKINFSKPQVLKSSRFIHRQMSLGTVLLFKLPLYESCKNKVREGPVVFRGPRSPENVFPEVMR